MMVPSIGQAIWFISSAGRAASSANDRSGTVHIVPLIWQRAKSRTRLKDRILTLVVIQLFMSLEFASKLKDQSSLKTRSYVGMSCNRSVGEAATLVHQQGGDPSQMRFVVDLRAWF